MPRSESMKKGIYILPNLLTSANLFCGFFSIVNTYQGKFEQAAWALIIALIFDALDGKIARLTNTTSQFGVEYDSLADVVSFGVAPAFLIYVWVLTPFGRAGWMGGIVYVLGAALRLARFNVQVTTVESRNFNGLPSPAAAILIATAIIFHIHFFPNDAAKENVSFFFLFVPYILAFLMISNVKYYAFKDLELFKRKPFSVFALSVIILTLIITEFHIAFFLLALAYVLSGLFNFLVYSPVKSLRAMFQDR